jgi:hypothetical protein
MGTSIVTAKRKRMFPLPKPRSPLSVPILDYDINKEILQRASSTDYAQGSFKPGLFCPISSPAQWSLDSSMDTRGLRHLSCVAKVIRQAISPIYMADPSESTRVEVPDFLVERMKKDAERKRIKNTVWTMEKEKGKRFRSQKCRERKRAVTVAPAESAVTAKAATYVSYTVFLITFILTSNILSHLVTHSNDSI